MHECFKLTVVGNIGNEFIRIGEQLGNVFNSFVNSIIPESIIINAASFSGMGVGIDTKPFIVTRGK